MKQSKKITSLLILLISMISGGFLTAQSNLGLSGTINSNGSNYQDFIIPSSMDGKFLYMTLTGADGGRVRASTAGLWKAPGQGATVTLEAKIGSGANEIQAGSTIRFIVGLRGADQTSTFTNGSKAGSSGGGTGVAFKTPGGKWTLLAVAGAGTGSDSNTYGAGDNGREGQGISSTFPDANTGTGGLAMSVSDPMSGNLAITTPGGGAFSDGQETNSIGNPKGGEAGWPNGPNNGEPTGGHGVNGGGWGFGGGGGPVGGIDLIGGGGGYKGGDVGYGGSSFLHEDYAIGYAKTHGANRSSDDGKVTYSFNATAKLNVAQIKFAYNTNKCIDDYASHTDNGTNIQTYNCHSAANQWWFFHPDDRTIRSKLNLNKCLDLDHSNVNNGTNIQLWDCNGTSAQGWLYNGIHKTIHSGASHKKCLDATNGAVDPNANVNVQLYDCKYGHPNMRWEIAGATTVSDPAKVKYIIPEVAGGFAVHSYSGAKVNSNIQLWTKDNTNTAEQWYFDGLAIKMRDHQDLCVDLYHSDVANGTNIQLYSCNSSYAQQWIYDGLTRTIRSVINQDKCMQIEKNSSGVYGARSNVVIWDCNGSQQQQFLIQE